MDQEQEELLIKLTSYMTKEKLYVKDIAKMLDVSANTLSNWRKGDNISPSNRRAIERLVRNYSEKPKGKPIPDDVDFVRLVGLWPRLSESMRSRVVSCALELIEKSGHESIDCDMGGNCKAN